MRTPSAILDEKFEQLFVPHMITNVVEEPFALLSELLEVLPDEKVLATEKAVVTAIFSTLKRNLSSWVGTEGLTNAETEKISACLSLLDKGGADAISGQSLDRKASEQLFAEVRYRLPQQYRAEIISACTEAVQKEASFFNLYGLSFSGGGIRSAAFSMGVAQKLAESRLLSKFHYLSAVSGGGYTASWLTAWAYRSKEGMKAVEAGLRTQPSSSVTWVRRFVVYLAPQAGLLSGDIWGLGTAILRNWLFNLVRLLPWILMLFAPPVLVRWLISEASNASTPSSWRGVSYAFVVLAASVVVRWYSAVEAHATAELVVDRGFFGSISTIVLSCLALILIASGLRLDFFPDIFASVDSSYFRPTHPPRPRDAVILFAWVGFFVGACVQIIARQHYKPRRVQSKWIGAWGILSSGVACAYFCAICGYAAEINFSALSEISQAWCIALAPAFYGLSIGFGELVSQGMIGSMQDQRTRARWARAGGAVLRAGFIWLLVAVPAILFPLLLPKSWMLALAVVCLLGAFLALTVGLICLKLENVRRAAFEAVAALTLLCMLGVTVGFIGNHFNEIWNLANGSASLLFGVGLVIAAFFLINHPNQFTLLSVYRDALVRTFLGASRPLMPDRNSIPPDASDEERQQFSLRKGDRFANIDPDDSPLLGWLRPKRRGGPPQFPLLLLNACLNAESPLQRHGRSEPARSFTFSPLFYGSADTGYLRVNSKGPASDRGAVDLGTAMAVSGAAMSPVAHRRGNILTALLLAFFNARLGLWMGHPRALLRLAMLPLELAEITGSRLTTHTDIHVTDGGHFENLGVYELVRRRCRRIVAVDASADPDFAATSLATSIRLCEVQQGVRIALARDFRMRPGEPSGAYCAVFDVFYPDGSRGQLLYIKATFHKEDKRLPIEVYNYWKESKTFPHESTHDQFFKPEQFEAYRNLGIYAVSQIISESSLPPKDIDKLFVTAFKHAQRSEGPADGEEHSAEKQAAGDFAPSRDSRTGETWSDSGGDSANSDPRNNIPAHGVS